MGDFLKDAIADAKAVRETAIANAKLALEEAFTPKLQNMLSQKIQNEIEIDEEEDEKEEGMHDDDEMKDEGRDDDEKEEGKMYRDEEDMEAEGAHEDEEGEQNEEDEMDAEDEEMKDDELDLEAIIKELEAEINEEDEDEPKEEGEERDEKDEIKEEDDEDDEKKEDIGENDVSSGIGKSDNAHDKKSGDSSDLGKANKAKHESVDEFDLDSILEALKDEEVTEGPDEEEDEEKNEVTQLRAELDETREAVKFMRDKLNEVNLLNAKLLFTNKLFRAYGLNNEQKMKVVETFDRASNLREVKLVYSTMAETFGAKKTEIKESKGSASKAVASTKSDKQKEVISEGNALRDRFKKLANII
jgi:hypothetical protein